MQRKSVHRSRSDKVSRRESAAPSYDLNVEIKSIGYRGDGVAEGKAGPIYVPFTVPADIAGIRARGERGTLRGIPLKRAFQKQAVD